MAGPSGSRFRSTACRGTAIRKSACAVRDFIDAHHGHVAPAGVVPVNSPNGPSISRLRLSMTPSGSLLNPTAHQNRSAGRWRSVRAFTQRACHFVLRLIVFQWVAPISVMIGSLPSVIAIGRSHRALLLYADAGRYRASAPVEAELTLALHFHAVDADVLLAKLSGSSGSRETTHALSR